jgi:hypothetical protein
VDPFGHRPKLVPLPKRYIPHYCYVPFAAGRLTTVDLPLPTAEINIVYDSEPDLVTEFNEVYG